MSLCIMGVCSSGLWSSAMAEQQEMEFMSPADQSTTDEHQVTINDTEHTPMMQSDMEPDVLSGPELYGDKYLDEVRKLHMAKQKNGKPIGIDYILAYEWQHVPPADEGKRNWCNLFCCKSISEPSCWRAWRSKSLAKKTEKKNRECREKRQTFEANLKSKGVILEKERSSMKPEVTYVKLHFPFKLLQHEAERQRLKKTLAKTEDQRDIEHADPHQTIERRELIDYLPNRIKAWVDSGIEDEPESYSDVYEKANHSLFLHANDKDKFFTDAERSYLGESILMTTSYLQLETDGEDDEEQVAHEEDYNELTHFQIITSTAFPCLADPSVLAKRRNLKETDKRGIQRLLYNHSYLAAFPLWDGPRKFHAKDVCLYRDVYQNHIEIAPNDKPSMRARLYYCWTKPGRWHRFQPLDAIRTYFGEKVAFYFAWLGFYTSWLVVPSIIGIFITIYGLAGYSDRQDADELCNSNLTMCPQCNECDPWQLQETCSAYKASYIFDNEATIVFAFLMALWASFFLDFWKRRNAELAYDWDVRDFSEKEPLRPQFRPLPLKPFARNPITGKYEKYYPQTLRRIQYLVSMTTIAFMLGIVLGIVVSIIIYRLAVRAALYASADGDSGRQQASTVTAFTAPMLNLIGIMFMSYVYDFLAQTLTDWENHKRQSDYEAHLCFKIFLFQFVNYYSSLFYVAFFQGQGVGYPGNWNTFAGFRKDQCPQHGCMLELTIQLCIVMVGKQAINNVQEVLLPQIMAWYNRRGVKGSDDALDDELQSVPWEYQLWKQNPFPGRGLFNEYMEMCIQYGFITLFVAAFPLAPLFALLNNIIEIRIDAHKVISEYRRPPAYSASGIGLWQKILEFLSIVSVVTNGLVIALTSDFLKKYIYKRDINEGLDGYIAETHPLSPVKDPASRDFGCHYNGLRDENGDRTDFFYEVTLARLAFLLVFEHLVFLIKFTIQFIIPDVPSFVKQQEEREAYLAEQAKIREKRKRKQEEEEQQSDDTDDDSHQPSRSSNDEGLTRRSVNLEPMPDSTSV
eukprot:m.222330 g.222330  ORF g.222330 m.222330 type:complete len:1024 (-) comp26328_c2_seq1:26-3097(-)